MTRVRLAEKIDLPRLRPVAQGEILWSELEKANTPLVQKGIRDPHGVLCLWHLVRDSKQSDAYCLSSNLTLPLELDISSVANPRGKQVARETARNRDHASEATGRTCFITSFGPNNKIQGRVDDEANSEKM